MFIGKKLWNKKWPGSTIDCPVLLPSVLNFECLFVTVELPMGQKKYSAKWLQIFLNIYKGKIEKEQSFHGVEVLSEDITWTCEYTPQVSVWAWRVKRSCTSLCSCHARLWPGENLFNLTWCFLNTTRFHHMHGKFYLFVFPPCTINFILFPLLSVQLWTHNKL